MSRNYYKLYIDDVLDLAETLVIKSEYTALRINQFMRYTHGEDSVDQNNPSTWKYYLNIAGEYHPTDPAIKVISLDTLQEIDFTKANLALHKATAAAYQYNSRYYRELLFRYPEHEQLIQGVLYPADLNAAIDAPDFSVVSYRKDLVEDNELSLIQNINQWLENFNIRWNNKQYTISDDWYGASVLGVMYLQLVPLILNLRLRACKTSEAHSFHVREYLASHGMLDVYLSKMTKKQALFFYRNINYIERNAGKQDTFYWLVEKIMSDRNLPLSEYKMHHSTAGMPASYTPQVFFRKKLINPEQLNQAQADKDYQIEAILNKEVPLAPGNKDYASNHIKRIESLFKRSLSSTLSTKMLESSMVNYTDAVPHTLHQVFLNQWIAFINTGRFNTNYIRIKSPRTNKELLLNTRDAYIYYLYAFSKWCGVTLMSIPPMFAMRVQREPTPDVVDLMSVVSEDYVPQAYAHFILSLHTSIGTIQTLDDFRTFCRRIHRSAMEQLYFVYQQENMSTRAMTYNMVHRLYEDIWYASPDSISGYESWMSFRNLEYGFTATEWQKVYLDIYEAITGVDMSSSENIVGVQKAMVSLLSQLSSYSIQITSDVNTHAIRTPNWNTVRIDQIRSVGRSFKEILLGIFNIFSSVVYPKDTQFIPIEKLFQDFTIKNPPYDGGDLIFPINVAQLESSKFFGPMDLGILRLNQDMLPLPDTASSWQGYPNFAAYFAMTQADRAAIKDIYCYCHKPYLEPKQANIEDMLLYSGVPGFKYQQVHRTYAQAFNYYYLPQKSFNFIINGQETELNCFYPNFDPDWLDNFHTNKGSEKLDNFTIFHDAPLENEVPEFGYTGGWDYLSVFSPIKEGDDERTLQGLTESYASIDVPPMQVSTVQFEIDGLKTSMDSISKTLRILYVNQDIRDLKAFNDRRSLENVYPIITYTADFSFNAIVTKTDASAFTTSIFTSNELNAMEGIFYHHTPTDVFQSTHTVYEVQSIFVMVRNVAEIPGINWIGKDEQTVHEDMTYVPMTGLDIDGLGIRYGFRSIKNMEYKPTTFDTTALKSVHNDVDSSVFDTHYGIFTGDSAAFGWLDVLPDHDVVDPTYDEVTGVVWGS